MSVGDRKALLPRGAEALLVIADGTALGAAPPEDPCPRVHAFNCLRMIFNDTDLSVDTQSYCAEGLRVSSAQPGDPSTTCECFRSLLGTLHSRS